MHGLRAQKVSAAFVMITWLAALISAWGIATAGREAVAGDVTCVPKDLNDRGLQLELASSPRQALQVLNGEALADPCVPSRIARILDNRTSEARCAFRGIAAEQCARGTARCIRRGMAAQVRADYLFIPAYSLLTLALFLFVGTFWEAPAHEGSPRKWSLARRLILLLGVLVVLAMAAGDVLENRQLTAIIQLGNTNLAPESGVGQHLPYLAHAGTLKWGALALSAALLAGFWKSSCRLIWIPRILGLATAAVLAAGLGQRCWWIVSIGMTGLALLWFAGLVHALATAVAREPDSNPSPLHGDERT